MIKKGIINEQLAIDSRVQKGKGSCPLMPEEVFSIYIFDHK